MAYIRAERAAQIDAAMSGIPYIERCSVQFVPEGGIGERLLGTRMAKRIRAVLESCDVAHLHGVWDTVLALTARLARRRGVPYVVVPSGMLDPWALSQRPWKKKLALALGYRAMLDHALFLHALNPDEARQLGPLRLRAPIEVFPNGVFLEELSDLPAPGAFRATLPALANRPYVLFLGRLHHKKGLDYLADAFAKLAASNPDVALVVAGPEQGAGDAFRSTIARAGLEARTHLVGSLSGRDKLAALVDATCFCLPSRSEGFSVAVLEALACGVPVVISNACNFPEVELAGAGEIVDLDAAKIAHALHRVASQPDVRERMSCAAIELVRTRYTWPAIAAALLRAYVQPRSRDRDPAGHTPH